jgi:hypothetical protein
MSSEAERIYQALVKMFDRWELEAARREAERAEKARVRAIRKQLKQEKEPAA